MPLCLEMRSRLTTMLIDANLDLGIDRDAVAGVVERQLLDMSLDDAMAMLAEASVTHHAVAA